ncbi:helix-turn-helix domain-containing protein [Ureibacillus thermophilus]|nr:helix-turn-helix domain-containing protein [Ureibacillus thermophilus]
MKSKETFGFIFLPYYKEIQRNRGMKMRIELKDTDLSTLLGEQASAIIVKTIEQKLEQYLLRKNTKEWMTLKEAQEYIGVSFNTLSKMRRMGLRVCEIDGIKRIKKSEIDRFLSENSY